MNGHNGSRSCGVWVGVEEPRVEGARGDKERSGRYAWKVKFNSMMHHAPHTIVDIDPGDSSNIENLDALELTHASLHSVWLNDLV